MLPNRLLLTTFIVIYSTNAKLSDDIMEEWNHVVSRYATECIEESGVNPVYAANIFNGRLLHDEEHIHCFIKCLNVKYGILSSSGVYDVDVWVKTTPHVTPEIANRCLKKHENEVDLCKKSYRLGLCVTENNYSQ
ncbi:hypothetical protein FQR65_LT12146 [Abscondita terminalis]|nr:hypothetical protein FQR65_LT12146 [Abscondita terminalis]